MRHKERANDQFKIHMRRVFWFFFLMLAILSGYFIKVITLDAGMIETNPYNTRMSMADPMVKRGSILDANGNVLAESIMTEAGYIRQYPYGRVLSHVVGYSANSKSGVEAQCNFALQTVDWEVWHRVKQLATGEEIKANHLVLTVDAELSAHVRDALGQQKGSIVVLEPSTGKVLSMISYPDYDPAAVGENWNSLTVAEDSPLLNRAAQGLYIPGSTFKIITAAAAIENLQDWESLQYTCYGEADFGVDSHMRCFNERVHGEEDLYKAFAQSCNTFFSAMGLQIPPEAMRKTASRFLINQSFDFSLNSARGSFVLDDEATTSEIIETAIGQGKTLVTPLNMAMAAASVANGGLLMKPYLVDRIEKPDGGIYKKYMPESLGQAMAYETADILTDMMVACVNEGTGAPAAQSHIQVAGKTGTAENPAGADHSWFVGFAPADDPQIAFAVLLENSGGGGKSLAVAKQILSYYFSR